MVGTLQDLAQKQQVHTVIRRSAFLQCDKMTQHFTIVFLPGIGADHRLFKYQTAFFPNSYVAEWIDPLPSESLEQYAIRYAEEIRLELNNRQPTPVVVCGLSLGGMIAPYIAKELNAVGCILLASVRKPSQFPRWYYADWWVLRRCPWLRRLRLIFTRGLGQLFLCFPWFLQCFVNIGIVRSFVEMPLMRFEGLARLMFDWAYRKRLPEENEMIVFDKPMLHIHGTRDFLLPIWLTNPDIRIQGCGHLPTLSHPEQVNEMITRFLSSLRLT